MRTTLVILVLALNGADLALTMFALARGGRELNPVLRPLSGSPGWFGAVKAGLMGGLVFGLWQAPRGLWALVLLAVGYGLVVAWNVRQCKA